MTSLQRTLLCLALVTGCSSDKDSKSDADPINSGEDGGDNGGTAATDLVDGCKGQKLREGIPDELTEDGPWPVGSITTMLGGVETEVWYPAKQGSEVGKDKVVYDMREHLPDADATKIPDEHVPTHFCNCYGKLPLDEEAGPYPVLLFVHGTAGFRTTNVDNMSHWASRGFVVIAADHPNIQLKDLLGAASSGNVGAGMGAGGGQAPEARAMLAEIAETKGDVAFLKGHIDMEKVGVMGHSAGGGAVSSLGDIADVVIVYAAGQAVTEASRAKSYLSVMGATDGVAGGSASGYEGTTIAKRRFVSIAKGGHLVGGNLCTMRDPADPMKDIVDLAEEYKLGGLLGNIPGALRALFGRLFDGCNDLPEGDDPFIPALRGIEVMNHVSTGVFEEALHCSDAAKGLSETPKTFGADVADYQEIVP